VDLICVTVKSNHFSKVAKRASEILFKNYKKDIFVFSQILSNKEIVSQIAKI